MADTGPVIISEYPGASYLVELLQLEAAYLADLAVLDLGLGVVAEHNYHPKKRLCYGGFKLSLIEDG